MIIQEAGTASVWLKYSNTAILEILCIYLQSLKGIATVGMIALIFVCLFHDSDEIVIVNTFVNDHYKCYNQ